jgi:putative ABC transport system permease protein
MLVIRTAGPPTDVVEDVRGQVWAADPDVSVALVRPMADIVSKTIARHRFALFLLASFAVTALLLATFGVYGLCAYSVGLRTHEIGIRMALGAQRSDVFHMVLRQGLVLTASGLVLGLIVSNIFTRYLASMLYEIKPTDPATLIGAAALLSAVAMVACYVPARRATDVDPVVAIRYE